jgi:hypothetical protein
MVPSDFIRQLLIGWADSRNAWKPSVAIGSPDNRCDGRGKMVVAGSAPLPGLCGIRNDRRKARGRPLGVGISGPMDVIGTPGSGKEQATDAAERR